MRAAKSRLIAIIASAILVSVNPGIAAAHVGTKLSLASTDLSACGNSNCRSGNGRIGVWLLLGSLSAMGAGMWQVFDNPVSR